MYPRKIIILAAEPMLADGTFADFDKGMFLGGQTRMDAAIHIAKTAPETEFIIVGGYNRPGEGNTTTSNKVQSMAQFLRRHCDNPHLELVYSLPCTRHNFIALFHYWRTAGNQPAEAGILTASWHLVRAQIFAAEISQMFQQQQPISFVPLMAEEVLQLPATNIAGNHQGEYLARWAVEKRGLSQLRDDTYQDGCLRSGLDLIENVSLALI
jgi:hypothetical protein